ncbi:MAG TPA: saccharopine dehydrogenase NADP-binding domain-containing protein [Candidatus Acidoferrales bacterium]
MALGGNMRLVVLGAGMMGRAVVYDLARSPDLRRLLVVDKDLRRAREVARRYGSGVALVARADAAHPKALARLLRGFDVVVNCTHYGFNLSVMQAALEAKTHYVDLGGLFYTTRKQLRWHGKFCRAGLLAILCMGSAPGLTNLMARLAADPLDEVHAIRIYNGARPDSIGARETRPSTELLPVSFSLDTMLDELTLKPVIFAGGKWREQPVLSGEEAVDFPSPVGRQRVRFSLHSEALTLPMNYRKKGLRDCFFKINYDDEFVARVSFLAGLGLLGKEPVRVGSARVSPRAMLHSLVAKQPGRSGGPEEAGDMEALRVVVEGIRAGRRQRRVVEAVIHASPEQHLSAVARDTGFPAAVAARMIARNEITARGVFAPESRQLGMPVERFFEEMALRGISITMKVPGRAGPGVRRGSLTVGKTAG